MWARGSASCSVGRPGAPSPLRLGAQGALNGPSPLGPRAARRRRDPHTRKPRGDCARGNPADPGGPFSTAECPPLRGEGPGTSVGTHLLARTEGAVGDSLIRVPARTHHRLSGLGTTPTPPGAQGTQVHKALGPSGARRAGSVGLSGKPLWRVPQAQRRSPSSAVRGSDGAAQPRTRGRRLVLPDDTAPPQSSHSSVRRGGAASRTPAFP